MPKTDKRGDDDDDDDDTTSTTTTNTPTYNTSRRSHNGNGNETVNTYLRNPQLSGGPGAVPRPEHQLLAAQLAPLGLQGARVVRAGRPVPSTAPTPTGSEPLDEAVLVWKVGQTRHSFVQRSRNRHAPAHWEPRSTSRQRVVVHPDLSCHSGLAKGGGL